jgi:uncharacterized protein YndB with AHSA1/START domain
MVVGSVAALFGFAAGCASPPRVGHPENPLPTAAVRPDAIRWPAQYRPDDAGFFVHNEIHVKAPPSVVWEELIRAEAWPSWYEGASNVRIPPYVLPGGAPASVQSVGHAAHANGERVLYPESIFTWRTMDWDFTSKVTEFDAPHRLAWESRKSNIKGYHAWLIVPTADGCKVVTEESQHGFLTLMQKIFVPNELRGFHDVWLAALKERSEARARMEVAKL